MIWNYMKVADDFSETFSAASMNHVIKGYCSSVWKRLKGEPVGRWRRDHADSARPKWWWNSFEWEGMFFLECKWLENMGGGCVLKNWKCILLFWKPWAFPFLDIKKKNIHDWKSYKVSMLLSQYNNSKAAWQDKIASEVHHYISNTADYFSTIQKS